MRRLPPQQIEKNLGDLIDIVPHLCEDLLSAVDQPLKIAKDKKSGKDYLLCDYNRDGDSYRSGSYLILYVISVVISSSYSTQLMFLADLHGVTSMNHLWMRRVPCRQTDLGG